MSVLVFVTGQLSCVGVPRTLRTQQSCSMSFSPGNRGEAFSSSPKMQPTALKNTLRSARPLLLSSENVFYLYKHLTVILLYGILRIIITFNKYFISVCWYFFVICSLYMNVELIWQKMLKKETCLEKPEIFFFTSYFGNISELWLFL